MSDRPPRHPRRLALVAVASLFAACAPAYWYDWVSPLERAHPLVGRIWSVAAGDFVAERAMLRTLAARRFVLLGERHDSADHHALQARLVRALVATGRRPVVAFEMLDGDQAEALARHLERSPRDAAGLGDAVGWDRTGWPPWPLYEPIARAALERGLPLAAASLARADVRVLLHEGPVGLGADRVARLGLDRPIEPSIRTAMAREISEAHCGQVPADRVGAMVDVQWARDAHMAERLRATGAADGTVLIAGLGHVRSDRGVPAHLRRADPGVSVAAVGLVEVRRADATSEAYAHHFDGVLPFDYVWFTPRVDDVDPCTKFERQLERLRRG